MVSLRRVSGVTGAALLALVALLGTGCGTAAPRPADIYFALEPGGERTAIGATPPPGGATRPGTLVVNEFATRGLLGGRQIIFRTEAEPLRVQRYEHLLWAEPVPRALSRNLSDALRAAGVFERVLLPSDRGRPDYLLNGEVDMFEHRPTATAPYVVGTLNLTLLRSADRRVVHSHRYHSEVMVGTSSPQAMAEAFNELSERLATAAIRDLRR